MIVIKYQNVWEALKYWSFLLALLLLSSSLSGAIRIMRTSIHQFFLLLLWQLAGTASCFLLASADSQEPMRAALPPILDVVRSDGRLRPSTQRLLYAEYVWAIENFPLVSLFQFWQVLMLWESPLSFSVKVTIKKKQTYRFKVSLY